MSTETEVDAGAVGGSCNSDEWSCCVSTLEGNNVDGDPMYWTVASPNGLRDEKKANATLIAEAPELYKALEALTGVVQSDPFLRYSEDSLYGKAIKAALAVLRKHGRVMGWIPDGTGNEHHLTECAPVETGTSLSLALTGQT